MLARPGTDGAAGPRALQDPLERYERGDWLTLLESLRDLAPQRPRNPSTQDADALLRKRRDAACRLVRNGEVSRARHALTSGTLAPGDDSTWATKRPDQPRVPIPPDIHTFQPEQPATVSAAVFAQTLREARRGAAPGLSGARAEHFKLLLGDADGLELLAHAAAVVAALGAVLSSDQNVHRACLRVSA